MVEAAQCVQAGTGSQCPGCSEIPPAPPCPTFSLGTETQGSPGPRFLYAPLRQCLCFSPIATGLGMAETSFSLLFATCRCFFLPSKDLSVLDPWHQPRHPAPCYRHGPLTPGHSPRSPKGSNSCLTVGPFLFFFLLISIPTYPQRCSFQHANLNTPQPLTPWSCPKPYHSR